MKPLDSNPIVAKQHVKPSCVCMGICYCSGQNGVDDSELEALKDYCIQG